MTYLEIEAKIISAYKGINPAIKKAFWITFALINFAFLFHTVNFMFGDHDWQYVRFANYWSEGTFEGRPLHFVLQSVFFDGQVLPVLNNLLSFAGLTLGGIGLAVYWRVPISILNYALFATFIGILPYTLVWLFYAKDTLINLSLPFICVGGLLLSDYAAKEKKLYIHFIAMFLFFFALSSYAAVVNLLAVCLLGAIMLDYARNGDICSVLRHRLPALGNMLVALILFKIVLLLIPMSSGYNTQAVALSYIPQKFVQTLNVMLTQFITPLPFMEYKYKLLLLVISLSGLGVLLWHGGKGRIALLLIFVVATLFSSKLAFFIAEERGQILSEMENFAFVPRLDFYGLTYIYSLSVASLLSFSSKKIYKLFSTLIVIATFISCVRDVYAQKVWKFGFDAEMKAHERIVSRLEQTKGFHPKNKYRLLQIGSLSLRENYYISHPNEATSLDLLTTSFTPEFMSRITYNFYYPQDIFYTNTSVEELSQYGKDYIRNRAKPFPSPDSIYIDGDIVVIVLTEQGLKKARSRILY